MIMTTFKDRRIVKGGWRQGWWNAYAHQFMFKLYRNWRIGWTSSEPKHSKVLTYSTMEDTELLLIVVRQRLSLKVGGSKRKQSLVFIAFTLYNIIHCPVRATRNAFDVDLDNEIISFLFRGLVAKGTHRIIGMTGEK